MEELEIEASQPLLLTAEGHKRLQDELTHLTTNKRAEIAERIRESKDHGEYSEDNNELDEVKMEQAIVEERINSLKAVLASSEILNTKQIPTDYVGLGSRVKVEDRDRGFDFEVRLVASVEADPDKDLISDESPMGQSLLGLKVGDVAEFEAPAGKIKYEIVKISR
ncbi:MAG: GreA/GreB family elongation factor [Armatimonadetes bacterium]|nr:GreA/GreB family elongation factor [Armatimonadota bacterium]